MIRFDRIGVFGAGAVGGLLAARLAAAGHPVTVIARGARLRAIRADGLRLRDDAGEIVVRPATVCDGEAVPPLDALFVAVKAQDLPGALPRLRTLIGPDTLVVPLVNGIPWWFHQPSSARPVRAVDPDGSLLAAVPPDRIAGAVVFFTAAMEGGLVRSMGVERLILGRIDGEDDGGVAALADLLTSAGIATEVSATIRRDLWTKVALNLATNPVSVIAGATLYDLFHDPRLTGLVRDLLGEAHAVARGHGIEPSVDVDAMMELGRAAPPFYTSMMQDFRRGATLELGAIGRAVIELAGQVDVAVPMARRIIDLADVLAAQRGESRS